MIINDLDGYYIVFDTKNWNTELDTLVTKLNDGPVIELDGPLDGEVYYIVDGKYYTQAYARILIRKKQC